MKIVARGMCTRRGYGCPHCSGADRDRLYALFIRVLKVGGWGIAMSPITLSLDRTREDPSITDPTERARYFAQRHRIAERAVLNVCRKA